jgi:hypothetical protein
MEQLGESIESVLRRGSTHEASTYLKHHDAGLKDDAPRIFPSQRAALASSTMFLALH